MRQGFATQRKEGKEREQKSHEEVKKLLLALRSNGPHLDRLPQQLYGANADPGLRNSGDAAGWLRLPLQLSHQ